MVVAPGTTASSLTWPTKTAAVDEATRQLASSGGVLKVYLRDGQFDFERTITPPSATEDVFRQVHQEGQTIDDRLSVVGKAIAIGAPLVGASISAFVSPEVHEAMSDGWIAVFFATLTFSLGCAGATVFLRQRRLQGYPLLMAVGACFLGALGIANVIGVGVLDFESTYNTLGGPAPARLPLAFVIVALKTYGPVGTVVSGGIGAWLGYRLAPLFE